MRSHEQRGGAQRERTGLAWQRSAFSFLALAGVVLSVAAHRDAPVLLALSALLVAAAAAVWLYGGRSYEQARVAAQPRALAALTLVTALAAGVAAVVVLVRL
jgi:uncharacterized membrane protein YidH (DUF202 family)